MSVRLTISTNFNEQIYFFELQGSEVLATLRLLLESDSGVAEQDQVLVYNGRALPLDGTISQLFAEQDVSLVLVRKQDMQQQQQQQQQQHQQRPQQQQQQQRLGSNAPPDATAFIQSVRNDPELLGRLSQGNPQLLDAVMSNNVPRVTELLAQSYDAHRRREEYEHLLATADPFDPVAQAKIEEFIRQKNVEENFENAVEHNPEAFASVSMLYVDVSVNGVHLKAFVDSGAQSTIMSEVCARKCNIYHLIDSRYSGMAKGVGTARILGRVHMAQLTIGGSHFTSSFTILEQTESGKFDLDFLLGLDNLKRHQACIDLRANVLRIGSEVTPFLAEKDIPGHEESLRGSLTQSQELDLAPAPSAPSVTAARPPIVAPPPTGPGRSVGGNNLAGPRPSPSPGAAEAVIQSVVAATGCTRQQAVEALRQCGGNPDLAAQSLMGGFGF